MVPRLGVLAFLGSFIAAWGCKGNEKIGQSCLLNVDGVPEGATINMSAPECKSGLCLKPAEESWPGPHTGATCTAECSSDSDCDGEIRSLSDKSDQRCRGGFACAVPFAVGPLCCKHLCVCRDFLGQDSTSTPVACQAADALSTCQAAAVGAPTSGVAQLSDDHTFVRLRADIDLVFMIDNSSSMGPKLSKLSQQFPKMIQAMRDPSDGLYYADVRVAIIDSDLGTGGAYPSGPCGPTANNGGSVYGDVGSFQMRGAASCGVDPDALWLEYDGGRPQNFLRTMDISQAFGCLAGNLGSAGCEAEHQLQALEFALAKPGLHQDQKGGLQNAFLRPKAFLFLVVISDEDDCSAASNHGMFGDKPELRGESASLRCATRGHQCGGMNLASTPPGYPTSARFEANLADCAPRTDACPDGSDGNPGTDTSGPTDCSPLKDVHRLAQEIKALKPDWEEKLTVVGIFGWPRMKQKPNGDPELDSKGRLQPLMADAKYKIDLVPNPDSADVAFPQIWDAWPICYDPDHEPATPGTFDAEAFAWGARPGLRMSAFIDEFGENGFKYSICERDFTFAMARLYDSLPTHCGPGFCIDEKLMDMDLATDGVQPDCRAVYLAPQVDPVTGSISHTESTQALPQCPPGATSDTITQDCWKFDYDHNQCSPLSYGQKVTFLRTKAEIDDGFLPEGTMMRIQCWTCAGSVYSPEYPPGCTYPPG